MRQTKYSITEHCQRMGYPIDVETTGYPCKKLDAYLIPVTKFNFQRYFISSQIIKRISKTQKYKP